MRPTEITAGQFEVVPNELEREPMQRIERVAVAYPSGNTTAIVFDEMGGRDLKYLNQQIMQTWKNLQPDQPEIEQCCAITKPQSPEAIARVEMFGGEFCGNATRSTLWLLAGSKRRTGLVEVSGVGRPLIFSVRDKEVMLEMPLPQDSEVVRRVQEGLLVQLDGIAQLVVAAPQTQTPRQLLASLLEQNKYRLTTQPCVGVCLYDQTSRKAQFCVWIREVDTVFDETACGSGTCAIGVARAWETGQSAKLSVIQPSGEVIQTEATYGSGKITASFITGAITVLYDGALELR